MADDPVARRMIADLQQQIAAMKQRTAPMGTGLGTFVGTQYQQNQTWNRQVGFPAELTSTFDPVTGYSWKALARDLAAPELTDPTPQNIGDNAIAIDGDETLTVGTRVWLEPDPMGVGYELQLGGGGDALGCSPFASLEATSCLQLTVRGTPAGRCEDIDPDQTILLEDDDEDGVWEGTTQFVTDTDSWDVSWEWPAGECCSKLTFTNGVDTVILRYQGCDNGKLVFIGYGTLLCAQNVDETPCAENSFTVEIECVLCPNPDYAGPGWYCVGVSGCTAEHTKACQNLTEDPGAGVFLCSGPHVDEATCAMACETPETVDVCGHEVSSTLFITITGATDELTPGCAAPLVGVEVQLTWDGDTFEGDSDPIDLGFSEDCGNLIGTLHVSIGFFGDDPCVVTVGMTFVGEWDPPGCTNCGNYFTADGGTGPGTPTFDPFSLDGTTNLYGGVDSCLCGFGPATIHYSVTE